MTEQRLLFLASKPKVAARAFEMLKILTLQENPDTHITQKVLGLKPRAFYGTTMTLPSVTNIIAVGTAGIKNGQLQAAKLNPEIEAIDVLGLGVKLCLDSQNSLECASGNDKELIGTSYAVPMVSAIAAIVWQKQPSTDAAELKSLIQNTSLNVANSPVGLARVELESSQNSYVLSGVEVAQQILPDSTNNFVEFLLEEPLEQDFIFAPNNSASEPSLLLTPSGSTTSP